jgi:hypothetical protein
MVSLASLWLPIVLSAVAVFVVSSVLHMVLTYHRSDYRPLPSEAETLASLRRLSLTPALYHFPYCPSSKEMGTAEMQAKLKEGPVGLLAVMPNGPMSMGKFLGQWMGYCLLVSLVVGYLAGVTTPAGAEALHVFRVVGTAGLLAYCFANVVDSIWKGYPWGVTCKHMIDGAIYALVAAGVFAWLWPAG